MINKYIIVYVYTKKCSVAHFIHLYHIMGYFYRNHFLGFVIKCKEKVVMIKLDYKVMEI